jgi:hypothetical protein
MKKRAGTPKAVCGGCFGGLTGDALKAYIPLSNEYPPLFRPLERNKERKRKINNIGISRPTKTKMASNCFALWKNSHHALVL